MDLDVSTLSVATVDNDASSNDESQNPNALPPVEMEFGVRTVEANQPFTGES